MNETIAAVATPPGEGGVAIIRISGVDALSIAEKVCSGPLRSYKSHTAHFSKILNAQGETIDEGLFLPMLAPRSYTGEDTVEIHCHGGRWVTQQVLSAVLEAGAKAAEPGEFTFRAFINGKLDLSQAEAVEQLIHAKNHLALRSAREQLEGRLSKKIRSFQQALVDIAAVIEAWVDFPEEGLEFMSTEEVIATLHSTLHHMRELASTFHEGRRLRDGVTLGLVGPPNAGKSSLMNALLGQDKAIVTPIAGTTRDVLEAEMRWGHWNYHLLDTAGIRITEDPIEQEGIRRSYAAIESADLLLCVLDATAPGCIPSLPQEKTLFVWNKIDLAPPPLDPSLLHTAHISAKEGIGLDVLQQQIETLLSLRCDVSSEEVLITSLRHHQALLAAIASLETVITALETGVSAEFVASDMRASLTALGTVIGTNITEEILSSIFSKFCVGK